MLLNCSSNYGKKVLMKLSKDKKKFVNEKTVL